MPHRAAAPVGAPCWIELSCTDLGKAEDFYGRIFGWETERLGEEFGNYANFSKGGEKIAGCMSNPGGMPDSWFTYLATTDIAATAAAVTAAGGQVVVSPMEVMDLGSMAVFVDVGGAGLGAWQPGTHPGFTLLGEPGAANWFELHTQNYDASLDFYRKAFGWDLHTASDTPEFRYSTLGHGESQLAGIMDASMFLPERTGASWNVYFGVDSADATLEQIVKLGGTVVQAAEDTPYGRLAGASDRSGAFFRLISGAPQ